MYKFFRSLIDVRRHEIGITLLMFANYYLLLVTYYFLKPARDSLFLTKVSPEQLPLVFILTAIITAPVTSLYSRASRTLKLNRLISMTTFIIILNLFILRWLIQINQPWVYYLFYTWVSIFGALTTSQFWLLANAVFDAAQAKRIFVLLGLGGIVGAFTGGEVTSLVVKSLGVSTENLLFFCIGILTVTIILVWFIWPRRGDAEVETSSTASRSEPPHEKLSYIVKTIMHSRHLSLTVGIIAMTMMVASFIDFQFKTVSFEAIPDKAELTSFLGQFYGRLSLVSLLFQILFAYRFIRWLGVGGVISLLPVALMAGSAAMFIFPGLLAGVLLRGADGSLKYSLDKTGRELLFLPVPLAVKKRTKIFVDLFVDRWFRGLAGGLLLLCTMVFALNVQQISLVVLALLAVWLMLVLMMRKEYVNSFRRALERREIDPADLTMPINDVSTINTLVGALGSRNERQVAYALDMLTSVKEVELVWPVKPLLQHSSPEIRRRALQVLRDHDDGSLMADVEKSLNDDDIQVRREAVHFLCSRSQTESGETLRRLLGHPDAGVRHAALACIAEYGNEQEVGLVTEEFIEAILRGSDGAGETGRLMLARFLATADNRSLDRYFDRLFEKGSVEVTRETIAAVGRRRLRAYVPRLLHLLADKDYRQQARLALVEFGPAIIGTLGDYLHDRQTDRITRIGISRVLKEIPHQESVNVLTRALEVVEPSLKLFVLRALNSLRAKHPALRFDRGELENVLISETRAYFEILQLLAHQGSTGQDPAEALLKRALEEKQKQNLEHIFRLLGLVYPPKDIYHAYQGITSGKRVLHANAIEFLDNLLRSDVKKYVFPILDDYSGASVLRKGEELFRVRIQSKDEALTRLMEGSDVWLRVCAIYSALPTDSSQLLAVVERAAGDRDPLVAETARLVLSRRSGDPSS